MDAAAESYPRCGADACSAPQPAAFEGSDKFGNLTFTLQLSANSGLVPFGQAQSWAVGNATLALLLPVIGEPPFAPARWAQVSRNQWCSRITQSISHPCGAEVEQAR